MRVLSLILLLVVAAPAPTSAKEINARAVSEDQRATRLRRQGPALKTIAKDARLGAGIGNERPFGMGIVLGQPLGGTFKYFFSPELAVQGMVAWWLFPHYGMVAGADVVYHVRDLAPRLEPVEIGVYFGAGVGSGFWNARVYHEHMTPWPHWHSHDLTQLLIYMRPVLARRSISARPGRGVHRAHPDLHLHPRS